MNLLRWAEGTWLLAWVQQSSSFSLHENLPFTVMTNSARRVRRGVRDEYFFLYRLP